MTFKMAGRRQATMFSYSLSFVYCLFVLPLTTPVTVHNENNEVLLYRSKANLPIIVTTWPFTEGTEEAWNTLMGGGSGVEAIVAGCTYVEGDLSVGSVGYGGSPDEEGETTLDAMIMDGVTHDVGSVGGLRRVKNAIGVAHAVMKYTKHTLLVGSLATEFAVSMGFPEESLSTEGSTQQWENWKGRNCQPNFRQNVTPDPTTSCGPYSPADVKTQQVGKGPRRSNRFNAYVDSEHHDTIGMVAVDAEGNISAGTSTNGAGAKVPGRVGDSPIVGSGSYADNDIGAVAATGDGDVMMRFLPSFHAVEKMGTGLSPSEACAEAVAKIARYYPSYNGALVAVNKAGEHGAACHNFGGAIQYTVRTADMEEPTVYQVSCTTVSQASHSQTNSQLVTNLLLSLVSLCLVNTFKYGM